VRVDRRFIAALASPEHLPTVLVDDNDADVFVLQMALCQADVTSQLFVASDGAEALMLADEIDRAAVPGSGKIRCERELRGYAGGVFSTCPLPLGRREAARSGANLVLEKPMELDPFSAITAELKALISS
jgi:hypothetical protein